MKDEDITLAQLLLELKFKLRLLKAAVIFLLALTLITGAFTLFVFRLSNEVEFKLGEAVGVTKTLELLLHAQSGTSQTQLQRWEGVTY